MMFRSNKKWDERVWIKLIREVWNNWIFVRVKLD